MYRITKLIIGFAAIFAFNSTYGQDIINIADTQTDYVITCTETLILTDSGGSDGDYGPNESHTITLCIDQSSDTHPQILISPELYGDMWDVDENSNLMVYDGSDASAPLLGSFNSTNAPAGITVEGSQSCLTIVFTSGNASSGAGFTATLQCFQPFQDFDFSLTGTPVIEPFKDLPNTIQICFGEEIGIQVQTSYPLSDAAGNGYAQADSTSLFRYIMGDGTIYQGHGLTEITHTYENPFGYLVNIFITDVNGFVQSKQLYVLIAPRPKFSNIAVKDTLCIDSETDITGGISGGDTLGIAPGTSAILGGGIFGEQMYLPDGDNNLYETTIIIDEFDDDQVIESVSDIISMCVNMEHSYLGDLEMGLTCPDGTMIIIFNSYNSSSNTTQMFPGGFGGGNVYLGDALWGSTNNGIPGIGFDYCFSDDAITGTFAEVYNDPEYLVNTTVTPGGKAIAAGTYLPEESFESFLGCPINGEWTLSVKDNWSIDDGFIFNWSVYFNPNINPAAIYYSPGIDSVYWEANQDIVSNNGATITVNPSQEGNNSFTFVAVDEFGCVHDTVVNIYVRPEINLDDDIACDLTQILSPYDDLDQPVRDGVYTMVSGPTATADIIFEQLAPATYEATATEYGIYEIMVASEDCGYTATALIDYRPDPVIEPLITDTILCLDASIVLDAGPQEANSGNFDINWISSNTGVFNTEDYAVTIDETGTYYLVITGHCGVAMDTTNVASIRPMYPESTVCGLQSSASVKYYDKDDNEVVDPNGAGSWNGPENISFTNANQLGTQISSSKYGAYEVTFTDHRCLNDGVTRQFRFVEQPEAIISPRNPEFCVDSDSLILNAGVSGSFNGIYRWKINGAPEMSTGDSLFFGANDFDPLVDYLIEVTVQDDYNICPLTTGEINFTGKWCEYNIPNVVTPNGDGKNDKFHVEFIEYFPNTHLRIYDRWGLNVFDQPNFDQYQNENGGWDPVDMETGTYFFELLLPNVDKIESGYIQVLKKDVN